MIRVLLTVVLFLPGLVFSQITPDSLNGWQNLRWNTPKRTIQIIFLNAKAPRINSFFGESALIMEYGGWQTRLRFDGEGLFQVIQEKTFLQSEDQAAFEAYHQLKDSLEAVYGKSEKIFNYWMHFKEPFKGKYSRITLDLQRDSVVGWKLLLEHRCLSCRKQNFLQGFPMD